MIRAGRPFLPFSAQQLIFRTTPAESIRSCSPQISHFAYTSTGYQESRVKLPLLLTVVEDKAAADIFVVCGVFDGLSLCCRRAGAAGCR